MIPFNIPYVSGKEESYIREAISLGELSSNGIYTQKCQTFLDTFTQSKQVLLTSSCTHALEMIALLCDIQVGDEVIMPSYTFVSSANAFVLRGAKIVFVDIRPDTMNIDERLIETAITNKTKAILVMHYGGVACEMGAIMKVAEKYNLIVVEDAAHCIGAYLDNKHLGTIGHFGALSFHSTKNVHCGEGGALLINDERFIERAEIIREKGTNRRAFFRGEVNKYSWVDVGSSYLMSELNAAFLYAQLLMIKNVTRRRQILWKEYHDRLRDSEFEIMPDKKGHNAHIFFIKCRDKKERSNMVAFLKKKNIQSAFHYIPLHTAPAGKRLGSFSDIDVFTSIESDRLLRLPLYYNFQSVDVIINAIDQFIKLFYGGKAN